MTSDWRPRQAVILAGGRGERMRPFTDHTPKHLYPFHGKPFAAHLVELLAGRGFERVLFLLGYRADATKAALEDGSRYGVRIEYDVTPPQWQTTLRMRHVRGRLDPVFAMFYCDNWWPMPFLKMWEAYRRSGAAVQLTGYDNADRYSTPNLEHDLSGRVIAYGKTEMARAVDIGFAIIDRSVVDQLPEEDAPLEAMLYPRLAAEGRLQAFLTAHRYCGVGKPERLAETARMLGPQRTLLVDRDGVLNRRPAVGEYVRSWADWEWMPGAREGLAKLRRSGWRVAVVTNQAGVARGMVSAEALAEIHCRMIAESSGVIEGVYVCPHGWDEGCRCRKPAPGLLHEAQRAFDLDLSRTWFAGDDERDAQAAEAAGCRFFQMAADGAWQRLLGALELEETVVEQRTVKEAACVS
ncbi:MAG: HAD-IIIA family hydrolase [Bryobacteraceae bacterium]